MSISFYINRIRLFGLKGILTYPRTLWNRHATANRFRLNALLRPVARPARGVTVIAELSRNISLSKTMRDLVLSLRDAGIPYQTFDTTPKELRNAHLEEIADAFTDPKDFKVRKYSHVISMFASGLPKGELGLTCGRVAFWEFESGFDYCYPEMCCGTPRIGMSDFNVDYFRKITTDGSSVHKILYPFRGVPTDLIPAAEIRAKYGLAPDDFVVFFNFDLGSTFYRKNPDGAMRAFARAFAATPKARLVFKTMRAKRYPEDVARLEALASELGIADRFLMIHDYLTTQEMYSLANVCDVYLSLHRGEGFGITLAEAMALGKPVVATDYSSTTEFCNRENSIPVPFRLVHPSREQIGSDAYNCVDLWAEPDWQFAGDALKALYADPARRRALGETARHFIGETFSIANFRKSVEAFLEGSRGAGRRKSGRKVKPSG